MEPLDEVTEIRMGSREAARITADRALIELQRHLVADTATEKKVGRTVHV